MIVTLILYWGAYFGSHHVLSEYADVISDLLNTRIKYFNYTMENSVVERHELLKGLVSLPCKILVLSFPVISIVYSALFRWGININDLSSILTSLAIIDLSSSINPWRARGRINWYQFRSSLIRIIAIFVAEFESTTAPAFVFEIWDNILDTKLSPVHFNTSLNQLFVDDDFLIVKKSRDLCLFAGVHRGKIRTVHVAGMGLILLAMFSVTSITFVHLGFLYYMLYRCIMSFFF